MAAGALFVLDWNRCGNIRQTIELHAAISGDHFRNFSGKVKQATVVISRSKSGRHLAAKAADFAIGQNGFESVTHFSPILVVVRGQQNQDAAIIVLVANAPLFEKIIREIRRLQTFKRFDGHHGNLGVSFLIDFRAERRNLRRSLRVKYAGKVINVTLRIEVFDFFRACCEGETENSKESNYPTVARESCSRGVHSCRIKAVKK